MKAFLTPLSSEEENECLMRLKNGDLSAKEELILHNMRLVAHVAKKYQSTEEEMEDLISIGTIGLLKAVSTFDYDFGNRFATYAIRCIENELLMHFRKSKKTKMEVSLFEPIGTDKEGKQIHLMEVLLVSTQALMFLLQPALLVSLKLLLLMVLLQVIMFLLHCFGFRLKPLFLMCFLKSL